MAATEQFGKLNDGHFFLPPPPSLGVCAAVGFWPFSAAVHLKSRFTVWFGMGWTMAVMIVMMLSPVGSEERERTSALMMIDVRRVHPSPRPGEWTSWLSRLFPLRKLY